MDRTRLVSVFSSCLVSYYLRQQIAERHTRLQQEDARNCREMPVEFVFFSPVQRRGERRATINEELWGGGLRSRAIH